MLLSPKILLNLNRRLLSCFLLDLPFHLKKFCQLNCTSSDLRQYDWTVHWYIRHKATELWLFACLNAASRKIHIEEARECNDDIHLCYPLALSYIPSHELIRCIYLFIFCSCLNLMPELQLLSIHSMMQEDNLIAVMRGLPSIQVNTELFSTTARPTVAPYRTSIWGHRVRDLPV